MYRLVRWSQHRLAPGVRTLVGMVLMIGGVLGFLPILGFWMFPLGVAVAIADLPPLRHGALAERNAAPLSRRHDQRHARKRGAIGHVAVTPQNSDR